jgi:hypothetical protein
MKRKLFFTLLYFTVLVTDLPAQVTVTTTIPLSPATSLSASSLFTNDHESMTTLQEIACQCGPDYHVFSLHLSNSYTSIPYTFEPNYTYTINVTGSASATGNLSNPGASPISFAFSLGTPQTTVQPSLGCINDGDLSTILNYAGQESYFPESGGLEPSWHGFSTVDLMNGFLTGTLGISNFPNSSTTSTTGFGVPFTVSSTVNQFNIESYPVLGDIPTLLPMDPSGQDLNPVTPPTNTTLNINSVTVYKTTSLIHGTITTAPGWTLNTVPSGVSTYYQTGVVSCLIIESTTTPTTFTTPVFVATIGGSNFWPTATRTFTAHGTGGGLWTTTITTTGQVYTQWVSGNPPPTLPAGTPFSIIMNGSYNL